MRQSAEAVRRLHDTGIGGGVAGGYCGTGGDAVRPMPDDNITHAHGQEETRRLMQVQSQLRGGASLPGADIGRGAAVNTTAAAMMDAAARRAWRRTQATAR